ncbi:SRPBCC family protein [Nocardia sp. NPDC005745]|uniref:type II toxin-antitoxin system Rv0910 family toxin n=1 Tax=Nocardia sp. NPDC005745 TaxID=3157061 RepID=UPI0033C6F65C
MPEITTSRDIDTSQDKVWATISDPSRFQDWNTLHTRWADGPPTTLAAGVRMTEVVTIKGIVDTIDFVTDDYQPPRLISLSGSGSTGSSVKLHFTVEPRGIDGCTVTLHISFNSSMLFGPMGKLIGRAFGKQLDASLAKLSAIVS